MFSVIQSASVYGVDGKSISVEVDISSGLPQISIFEYIVIIIRMNVTNSGSQDPYVS